MVQPKRYYGDKEVFLEDLSMEYILFSRRGMKTSKLQASFRTCLAARRKAFKRREKRFLSSREFMFSVLA